MAALTTHPDSVVISEIAPQIEGGRYPVKRVVGASLPISADIFKDGPDVVVARLESRRTG